MKSNIANKECRRIFGVLQRFIQRVEMNQSNLNIKLNNPKNRLDTSHLLQENDRVNLVIINNLYKELKPLESYSNLCKKLLKSVGTQVSDISGCNNKIGDLNGDGLIDLLDILSILKHIIGEEKLKKCELLSADLNCDGKVDISDLILLIQHLIDSKPLLECGSQKIKFVDEVKGITIQNSPFVTMSGEGYVPISDDTPFENRDFPTWQNYTLCTPENWGGDYSVLPPGLSCCDHNNMSNNPMGACCDYGQVWWCDNQESDGEEVNMNCYGAGNGSEGGSGPNYNAFAAGPCMCGSMAPHSVPYSVVAEDGPWGWGKCGGVSNGKYCQSDSDCVDQSTGPTCEDWTMDSILANSICEENSTGRQEKLNGFTLEGDDNEHQGSCAAGWRLLSEKLGGSKVRVGGPGYFVDATHVIDPYYPYENYYWDLQLPNSQFCDFGPTDQIMNDQASVGFQIIEGLPGNYPHCNEYAQLLSWPYSGYDLAYDIGICGRLGCTDSEAVNYDADATIPDGSCIYPGCFKYCSDNPGKGFYCNDVYPGWPAGVKCPCPLIDSVGMPQPMGSDPDYDILTSDYITYGYSITSAGDSWSTFEDCEWCSLVDNYLGDGGMCNYHNPNFCDPKIMNRYYVQGEFEMDFSGDWYGDEDDAPCCDYWQYMCPHNPNTITDPDVYDQEDPTNNNSQAYYTQAECGNVYDCDKWDGDGDCPVGEHGYQEGNNGWCECNGTFDTCGVCNGTDECYACNSFEEPAACNGTFFDGIIHDPDLCLFPGDDAYPGCDCVGNVLDCAGACGGDAVVDDCGICNGGCFSIDECDCSCPSGEYDECGVCDGDNSTCTDDCGMVNGNNWLVSCFPGDGGGPIPGTGDQLDCHCQCEQGTPESCNTEPASGGNPECGMGELDYCNMCLYPSQSDMANECIGCMNEWALNYKDTATYSCMPASDAEIDGICTSCIWTSCMDDITANIAQCENNNGAYVDIDISVDPPTGSCKNYQNGWLFRWGQWLQVADTMVDNGCGSFSFNDSMGFQCNNCGCIYPCNAAGDGIESGGTASSTGECCTYPTCWYYDSDGDGLGCPYLDVPGGENPIKTCSQNPGDGWVLSTDPNETDPSMCTCDTNQRDYCGMCMSDQDDLWNRTCCNYNGDAYCAGEVIDNGTWYDCDGPIQCNCDTTGGDWNKGYCSIRNTCICGRPCAVIGGQDCVDWDSSDDTVAGMGNSCYYSIDECGICDGRNDCIGCVVPEALNCTDNFILCPACSYGEVCYGFYDENAYIAGECAYPGCSDENASNYDDAFMYNDGSCEYDIGASSTCWGPAPGESISQEPLPLELFPNLYEIPTRLVTGDTLKMTIALDRDVNPFLTVDKEVRRIQYCIETKYDVGMAPYGMLDNKASEYYGTKIVTNPCYIDETPTATSRGYISSFSFTLSTEGFTPVSDSWGNPSDWWNLLYDVRISVYDQNGNRIRVGKIDGLDDQFFSPSVKWDFSNAWATEYYWGVDGSGYPHYDMALPYFNSNGHLVDQKEYFLIPVDFGLGLPIASAGTSQVILKGDEFVLNALSTNHPDFSHLRFKWSVSGDPTLVSEFESLNPEFYSNTSKNPVVQLTSPNVVGNLQFELNVNDVPNRILGTSGLPLYHVDCDYNSPDCINSNTINVISTDNIYSPNNYTFVDSVSEDTSVVYGMGRIGRRMTFNAFPKNSNDEFPTVEFSTWLKSNTTDKAIVRFGASGYNSKNRGCAFTVNMSDDTITESGFTSEDILDPSSGGHCDDFKLYKFPGGWYKVTGQFTVNWEEDFRVLSSNSKYEFAVFPGETGELVPCEWDSDCTGHGFAGGWCCNDNSSYEEQINNDIFRFCKTGEGNLSENHCMQSVQTAWGGSDEEHGIFVWGMHFNEMSITGGSGSNDKTTVFLKDSAYFNRTKTKTKRVLTTDNRKRVHYKKIRSKPTKIINNTIARRSKKVEDKLLASGYTCEQIGGCYYNE